jgi:hypothetical protein
MSKPTPPKEYEQAILAMIKDGTISTFYDPQTKDMVIIVREKMGKAHTVDEKTSHLYN